MYLISSRTTTCTQIIFNLCRQSAQLYLPQCCDQINPGMRLLLQPRHENGFCDSIRISSVLQFEGLGNRSALVVEKMNAEVVPLDANPLDNVYAVSRSGWEPLE